MSRRTPAKNYGLLTRLWLQSGRIDVETAVAYVFCATSEVGQTAELKPSGKLTAVEKTSAPTTGLAIAVVNATVVSQKCSQVMAMEHCGGASCDARGPAIVEHQQNRWSLYRASARLLCRVYRREQWRSPFL